MQGTWLPQQGEDLEAYANASMLELVEMLVTCTTSLLRWCCLLAYSFAESTQCFFVLSR